MKKLLFLSIMITQGICGCTNLTKTKDISGPESMHIKQLPLPGEIGGNMTYQLAGDPEGQQVIFLHGTPGDRNAWKAYMEDVPAGLEYLSVDRPAFGDSDPEKALPIMQQVELVSKLLRQDDQGRKSIIVGHSYGGTMAAIMAATYPDKVGAIVILAGSVSPELDNPTFFHKLAHSPPFLYLVPKELRKANDEVIALAQESKSFPEMWTNITGPVVVLQGDKDFLVSVKNVDYMYEKMINAKLDINVLKDGGHFLPWNDKEKVEERIRTAVIYSRE